LSAYHVHMLREITAPEGKTILFSSFSYSFISYF